MNTLFLVATPIGNLEDITLRALRVLAEVDLIAAEDTRRTRVLLNHFDITAKLVSYHDHNKLTRLEIILKALEDGNVALVSDAGTPALNDPGYLLVKEVLKHGHQVSPIPGPSAPLAALVASGLPTDRFTYLGYFPRKNTEQLRHLKEIKHTANTLVYLESPHRLVDALMQIQTVFGDRQLAVARELTKMHEKIFRGKISEAVRFFSENPPKGEITVVIAGALPDVEKWSSERLEMAIKIYLDSGKTPAEISRNLSKASGWRRREVYEQVIKIQNKPAAAQEQQQ